MRGYFQDIRYVLRFRRFAVIEPGIQYPVRTVQPVFHPDTDPLLQVLFNCSCSNLKSQMVVLVLPSCFI